MKTYVKVLLNPSGQWQPGKLTDEQGDSSHGLPVVVVDGEDCARGPGEVFRLHVNPWFRLWAERAGFAVK